MKVFLNVYDLHHSNNYAYYFGVGLFHSGVEIGSKEYSFGGHEYSYTGVFDIQPRTAYGVKFRESICLGETSLTPHELQRVIDDLSDEFPGNCYHPLTRNCNTFSNELCEKVLKTGIPSYVNRLANMGSALSCLIPQSGLQMLGILPPTGTPDDSNDLSDINKGENSRLNSPSTAKHTFLAFSGIGSTLSDDNSIATISLSDDVRRERAAQAAYKRMTHSTTTISSSSSSQDIDE